MKILIVIGTRPEAIKLAPLINLLKVHDNISLTICVTAQHRQMLDQVLDLFEIRPDFDLNIMTDNQDLSSITAKILTDITGILSKVKPDLVLVHGDTTTAFATSLACFYMNVKIFHVEAGLRTHNLLSPFPEEYNRQSISKLADFHYAPTLIAKENLLNEGVLETSIMVTGNTVIDALKITINDITKNQNKRVHLNNYFEMLFNFNIHSEKFILITGHRRENLGLGFNNICDAVISLAIKFPAIKFIYPVHLNPNVNNFVYSKLSGMDNIKLIQPLDYQPFVYLLSLCYLVLTDSGGIQEEAPAFGKPVLVMRDKTERVEGLNAGVIKLVGTDKDEIVSNVTEILNSTDVYNSMACSSNLYGDGNASRLILNHLLELKK